jgi:hypothetical protein
MDESLFKDPSALLAFRAGSSTQSFLLKAQDLKAYIDSLGLSDVQILDFTATETAPAPQGKTPKASSVESTTGEKEVQMGVTVKKDEDFPTWYSQVLTRTEMLDYYDISGCYILRPWAHSIWKRIQGMSALPAREASEIFTGPEGRTDEPLKRGTEDSKGLEEIPIALRSMQGPKGFIQKLLIDSSGLEQKA